MLNDLQFGKHLCTFFTPRYYDCTTQESQTAVIFLKLSAWLEAAASWLVRG